MTQRVGLYLQDKHPLHYEIEMAKYAEERGFSEIWVADAGLSRDCIVVMSALLTQTRRMRIGSGVLPIWTRNVAVIGSTFSTLWELGGKVDGQGRVLLGLGAWWEPICSRVGEKREKPLKAMREFVQVLYDLFRLEEVTFDGKFVHLDRVRLDVTSGDISPRDIPIYIGASGPRMLELAGEVCNGPLLNYGMSLDSIRKAIDLAHEGGEKAGKSPDQIDCPELIVCCLSDTDPQAAMMEAKTLVAYREIIQRLDIRPSHRTFQRRNC